MIAELKKHIDRAIAAVRQPFRLFGAQVNVGAPVQVVQVQGLVGEQIPAVELFQQFGFVSAPPDGFQGIGIPLGGRTSALVIVACEHVEYRFQVSEVGEAALYNQWGDVFYLKKSGEAYVKARTKVTLDCPQVHITGDLNVDGSITSLKDVSDGASGSPKSMHSIRQTYDDHDHPVTGPTTDKPNQKME